MSILQGARRQLSVQPISRFRLFAALCAVLLLAAGASAQNLISTVAGGGTINPNPALADLPGPTAVVEDPTGNKYVAAPPTDYIFQLTTSGAMQTFAGLGYGHYSINGGHNGVATQEPLYYPSGLGVDTQGSIYIADTINNTIRKVYLNGGTWDIVTVAGVRQGCIQTDWPTCNDGAPATKAYLLNPQGVAIDAKGNLYIADTGNNVIRYVPVKNGVSGKISVYAGQYNGGSPCPNPQSPCGDGGLATQALMNGPMSVALDSSNNLYIADAYDNRIRCVLAVVGGCGDTSHTYAPGDIITLAGIGVPCTIFNDGPNNNPPYCGDGGPATAAKIGRPEAVTVSPNAGVIYVTDSRASLIRVISGGVINTFAGTPESPGFAGDGGAATAAELQNPGGVFLDAAGNVLIADTNNQRIREVNTSGVINTIMGGGLNDGAPATSEMLANPYQVAVDANNNFYIADAANNRVRVVNTNPNNSITIATVVVPPLGIATIAGNGDVGYTGDGGPATQATMDEPFGVAIDASGNIYISDSQNGWVREVSASTGVINTLSATKPVTLPAALAFDKSGNLFIADPPAQVIWEISGSTITQVVGTGQMGYSGDGGPATAAKLDQPSGIAMDANENLYIADSGNNVIRCVSFNAGGCGNAASQAGYIYTYAYNGVFGFQGDGGAALSAERWDPTEVAVDARANLFVGGGQYPVVQRVDALTGTIITVAGNDKDQPSYGFSGDGGAATLANLNNMGLVIDSNENLLIADNGNNRIREVPLVAVAHTSTSSLTFAAQKVGTSSQPQTVTLTNIGADDLFLTSNSITITGGAAGDFSQTNNCPVSPAGLTPKLVPPQTCNINVTFTPTRTGTRKAVLTITDNGYKSPQKVSLTGTGD